MWQTFIIEALVRRSSQADDHEHFGWHQALVLRGVLASLSANADWLSEGLANLAHHSSGTRQGLGWSLALVAPVISCTEAALEEGVVNNFSHWHFGTDETIALFAASHGTKAQKLPRIPRWIAECPPRAPSDSVLIELRDKGYANNPFAWILRRLSGYVALRMSSVSIQSPIQLLIEPTTAAASEDGDVDMDAVWGRLDSHPLAGSSFELADVAPYTDR